MSKSAFEQILDEVFADRSLERPSTVKPTHKIPVNINDYEKTSEIQFNVAGFDKKKLDLRIEDDRIILTVRSSYTDGVTIPKNIKHSEFPTILNADKDIRREVDITEPEVYDLSKIATSLVDGILQVLLTKKAKKDSNRIIVIE